MKKKRGLKWEDIPRSINGLVALQFAHELRQYDPNYHPPLTPEEARNNPFLKALREAKQRESGDGVGVMG